MSDDEIMLAALAAIWLLKKWENDLLPGAKQAGVKAYEATHPKERGHMDDLPGHQWTKAKIMELAHSVGFPDPNLAAAIAMAESGGVPNARGDGGSSWGLWQIDLNYHTEYTRDDMQRPTNNALAAFEISKAGSDWRPWSTWWKDPKHKIGPGQGRYRAFL